MDYKKISDLLNRYKPNTLYIRDDGWIMTGPATGVKGSDLVNMFSGFGDSMTIKNLIWNTTRNPKQDSEEIMKLTGGKYTVNSDNEIVMCENKKSEKYMKNFNEFITERLINMKSFNKKVLDILGDLVGKDNITPNERFSTSLSESYYIETKYGKLHIILDREKSSVYSIFMRFDDPSMVNKNIINLDYNTYSGKWNIHTNDEQEALIEFEGRIRKVL